MVQMVMGRRYPQVQLNRWVIPLRFEVEMNCQEEQPLRREQASRHYRMVQVVITLLQSEQLMPQMKQPQQAIGDSKRHMLLLRCHFHQISFSD
jgi:hypothetical protein